MKKGDSKNKNYFLNLLKAARLERSLMTLSSVALVFGFANRINTEIFILSLCLVLLYAAGSIINAKTDNDFKIKNVRFAVGLLLITALLFSLVNYIIFFTVLITIFMSFIYSKSSRFVLFGDSVILALSHRVIPIVSASLLLGLEFGLMIKLSVVFFFSLFLMAPMKNMNGWKEDKKRGYKTLMTLYKNGKGITNFLFQVYFILVLASYFIFDVGGKFLFIVLIMFSIKILMDFYINSGREIKAYVICRLIIILFAFAFVFDQASNINLVFLGLSIPSLYTVYLLIKLKNF